MQSKQVSRTNSRRGPAAMTTDRRPVVLLLVLWMLVLPSLVVAPAVSSAEPEPTLEVSGPVHVGLGTPIELTLTLKHSKNVAGYETVLRFDPTAAEFGGLRQEEHDLKKLGRDVGSLTALEVPYGAAIGLYSCPVSDCVSRQGPKQDNGANGTLRLGTAVLAPSQAGMLELALGPTRVVDASGAVQTVTVEPATLTIQVGPTGAGPTFPAPASPWSLPSVAGAVRPADLTGDGQVTNADAMEVAVAWTRLRERGLACWPAAEPLPEPNPDVNRDGCVDVTDLQAVVANYSLAGATSDVAEMAPQPLQVTAAAALVVNSTGDTGDSNRGNGVCLTALGNCTLRAAIEEANHHAGADLITFAILGSGVQTITLTKELPNLFDESGPTTIDGYTQPGAVPNTNSTISNAVILIQVQGAGEEQFPGMAITSAGNVLRGLALYKLNNPLNIYGSGATDNRITGSFIGTNAAGSYGAAARSTTQAFGIRLQQGAKSNQIGGSLASERNVISGNGRTGVGLWHGTTRFNLVLGNLIGLTPNGAARLPNRLHGVDMNFGAQHNRFGGIAPGERNVISGNEVMGVDISHNANTSANEIVGNYIGTSVQGTKAGFLSNQNGIQVKDGVSGNLIHDNVIGSNQNAGITIRDYYTANNQVYANRIGVAVDGTAAPNAIGVEVAGTSNRIGPDNIIAHNSNQGVLVSDRATFENPSDPTLVRSNTITRNSIYSNGTLGIDLIPIGVSPNDPGDGDTGVNEQRNFPVLATATTSQVSGTACPGCIVEVFVAAVDPSGFGEGRTFLGAATAAADGTFGVAVSGISAGQVLTATATDPNGNTSEFARNLTVGGGATTPTSPKAPSSLSAQRTGPASSQSIKLQWTDQAANEAHFVLERSVGTTNNWSVLVTLPANTTSYDDTTVQGQKTYFYRVRATNTAGSSGYSNVASATTK